MFKLLSKNLFDGNLRCVHVCAAKWEKTFTSSLRFQEFVIPGYLIFIPQSAVLDSYLFLSAWYLNFNLYLLLLLLYYLLGFIRYSVDSERPMLRDARGYQKLRFSEDMV